jgi:Caspase domain
VTYPPPAGDIDTYLIYDDDLAAIADKSGTGSRSRVTFIFDSCHSGGMLRSMFELNGEKPLPRCWQKPPDLAARSATVPLPVRRLASFENGKSNVARLIIAAAREEESAWDALMDDGDRHGAFTYHATRALARDNALSADALINHVSPLVAVRFPQHPGLLGEEARFPRPIFDAKKR